MDAYERSKPWYDYFTDVILDPSKLRVVPPKKKDLPNHPANPNHKDYDPNKIW